MLATDDSGVSNHMGLTYRESLSLQQCESEKLQSRTSIRESDKRRLVHASDCLPSCDDCYPRSAFFWGWGNLRCVKFQNSADTIHISAGD